MIKDPDNFENLQISVYLKDGRIFERRDVPNVSEETGAMSVQIWDEDVIRVFPIDMVKEYVLHF